MLGWEIGREGVRGWEKGWGVLSDDLQVSRVFIGEFLVIGVHPFCVLDSLSRRLKRNDYLASFHDSLYKGGKGRVGLFLLPKICYP